MRPLTLVTPVTPGSTWHWLPVGPHWHLVAESGPDVDSAPVVQHPQQSVVGAGLDRDQLHPHRLEPHTRFINVFPHVLCVFILQVGGGGRAHLCRWLYEDPGWQHHTRVQRLGPNPEVDQSSTVHGPDVLAATADADQSHISCRGRTRPLGSDITDIISHLTT